MSVSGTNLCSKSVISETGKAPNGTSKIDEKEKYKCKTKGGFYSKVLGCFEQLCALVSVYDGVIVSVITTKYWTAFRTAFSTGMISK